MNIKCTISTPQFKNGKLDKMFEQSGEFCPETLKFYPDPNNNTAGSHMVQFDSVKEFEKYRTDKK